jgi:foldase protein PrsA
MARKKNSKKKANKMDFSSLSKQFNTFKKNLKKKYPQCCQKKNLYIVAIVICLGVIVYNFRAQFIVATVNGRPIFRTALIKELEKQAGPKVLESLIIRSLINQESQKNRVKISEEVLDEEVGKIEEELNQQNQDLDELLAARSMTRKDLREEIRLQKIAEALSVAEIEITDEEASQSFEAQKQFAPEGADEEALKEQVKDQLKEQKKLEAMQAWVENIRQAAKINYLLFEPSVANQ